MTAEHPYIFVADLTDRRSLEEVEVSEILALIDGEFSSRNLAHVAVAEAGRDEIRDDLRPGTYRPHGLGIEFRSRRALEAPVAPGAETCRAVGRLLYIDRRIEAEDAARKSPPAILSHIQRGERTVRAGAFADHRLPAGATAVRVEIILLDSLFIHDLDKVRGIHDVPLAVDEVSEYRALISPVFEILDRSRPGTDIRAAIAAEPDVVGADYIYAIFSGIVRILEHSRLSVREMLPERNIRIAGITNKAEQRGREGSKDSFYHLIHFSGSTFSNIGALRTSVSTSFPRRNLSTKASSSGHWDSGS